MSDETKCALLEAIQADADSECDRHEMEKAQIVRFVIIEEGLVSGEYRRVSYYSRSLDGSGLYPWETLGLLEWAKHRYMQQDFESEEE